MRVNNSKFKSFLMFSILLLTLFLFSIFVQHSQTIQQKAIAAGAVTVTVNLSSPDVVSHFLPGASFIQSDNNFSDANEEKLLSNGVGYLNVFIMGWGTDN